MLLNDPGDKHATNLYLHWSLAKNGEINNRTVTIMGYLAGGALDLNVRRKF